MKIAVAILLFSAGTAWADSGPEVLGKVDNAMNNFTDGEFESKLFIREPNGSAREIDFTTFQKVRRVGTHVKAQTFMGSDFSYEDMSLSRYSPTYDAKLVKEDANSWELELNVKPGQEIEYPRIHMWVEKKSQQPTKIDFMDGSGKVLKTSEYVDYHIDDANHYGPSKVVVTDHRRNDHKSEIVFTRVKLNQGLKDDFFTQRTLIRGH